MKMRECTLVICRNFCESHVHFLRINFLMLDGSLATWPNPSREIAEMMMYHSRTRIVYMDCSESTS